MKKIKMTEEQLRSLAPVRSSTAKDLFNGTSDNPTSLGKADSAYETQKEVVMLLEIHEMLVTFTAKQIIPRFKAERLSTYRRILNQVARLESANNQNLSLMWESILQFHQDKIDEERGDSVNVRAN